MATYAWEGLAIVAHGCPLRIAGEFEHPEVWPEPRIEVERVAWETAWRKGIDALEVEVTHLAMVKPDPRGLRATLFGD